MPHQTTTTFHKTEMWHETYNIQWTVAMHKCYHGDLCDFEYAKTKVLQMSKLTTNFDQFQQKLSSALFTADSGANKNLKENIIKVENSFDIVSFFLTFSKWRRLRNKVDNLCRKFNDNIVRIFSFFSTKVFRNHA